MILAEGQAAIAVVLLSCGETAAVQFIAKWAGSENRLSFVTEPTKEIVAIGNLRGAEANAKRVIDAKGLAVAPGFIDMLGQSESSLPTSVTI